MRVEDEGSAEDCVGQRGRDDEGPDEGGNLSEGNQPFCGPQPDVIRAGHLLHGGGVDGGGGGGLAVPAEGGHSG